MTAKPAPSGGPFACPACGYGVSAVKDSRPQDGGRYIRRRRQCLACPERFTTYEVLAPHKAPKPNLEALRIIRYVIRRAADLVDKLIAQVEAEAGLPPAAREDD